MKHCRLTHSLLPACLFALLALAGCQPAEDKAASEEALPLAADSVAVAPLATDTLQQLTGLLQSAGLSERDPEALGVQGVAFQLLSQNSYFLGGAVDLEPFWGQCITVSGYVPKDWKAAPEQLNGQTTYNRQLFVVQEVSPRLFSYCHFTDTASFAPQGKQASFSGRVSRMQRPAPDIAYDYQLQLDKPYTDPNHPIQPGMLVKELPLVTDDFEVLSVLEAAVHKNRVVKVRGIQHQGYAESTALWVSAADSLGR